MSLKSCLSRKFSKSFREFMSQQPDVNNSDRRRDSAAAEFDRVSANCVESSTASSWSTLLPELLGEIIRRVEDSEDKWPNRQNVVACACVCKRWRDITKEIVRTPSANAFTDKGKFLLAARRYRRGSHTEYIISLDADDISQGSNAYVGKLSSDFLGTNFTIYDSQPPHIGAKPASRRSSRRFASKQISPQVPAGNFEVGQVSYRFNLLKSRGPRRMMCPLNCPTTSNETGNSEMKKPDYGGRHNTVLRNKAPRWHDQLQCWCLNFHGRVTVASVKNFQLVVALDPKGHDETVLQFGKVGDETFTMDYRHPLSAFQAFAICLTSFGTKLACE